jgi:hypothetical protein
LSNFVVSPNTESTFLPFGGGGARFHNFALLTELLNFAVQGRAFEELLKFVSDSVLTSHGPQAVYVLKHREGETWKIVQPTSAIDHEVRLASDHAITTALESGVVAIASTDGWEFGIDEGSQLPESDSYRLLLIPIIDNLIPRTVLVAVVENSGDYSPADLELFALLQVVLSFVAYGSQPLDPANYDF